MQIWITLRRKMKSSNFSYLSNTEVDVLIRMYEIVNIQGRISFRWIWNMFHFIVPENKIMICCFKKRYVSKLCFRKSETCFHQMNNTMFHETLKDGLQKACYSCSCSNLYILGIIEHVLCKISLPCW
jgi:hypothetical protein